MSSNPLSRQAIHMEGGFVAGPETVRRWLIVCPLGYDYSMVCFQYDIVAAFGRVESEATTHGDSALSGPPLFPFLIAHVCFRLY